MKRTAFLVLVLFLTAPFVYSQIGEETPAEEDSLQTTAETAGPDSLQPEETVPDIPEVETTEVEEVEVIPNEPSAVLQGFFQALKEGNADTVSELISEDGLEEVSVMLDILKENLDDNEESTMTRLTSAGYTASADQIDDWSPMEYLASTIVLPVMKARYSMYDMEIGEFSNSGDRIEVPLTFTSSAGVQLPFQSELVREDGQWKVSTFMGLNSFP